MEKGGRVIKEHVKRTHGQSQGGVGLRVGGGRWGWLGWGESGGRKWKQLYLNNNKNIN